eukprot:scaffold172708_cov29-Tisochrysis_lutea.AAC.1
MASGTNRTHFGTVPAPLASATSRFSMARKFRLAARYKHAVSNRKRSGLGGESEPINRFPMKAFYNEYRRTEQGRNDF